METIKKYCLLAVYLCLFIQNARAATTRLNPVVNTNVGTIRGLTSSDGTYSMFLGIPYATVNEANPFGASIPHPGFDEVFEANDDSALCPQVEEFNNEVAGSLDCLHLNVYVPNNASTKSRLPVLVWIYGGGFVFGYSGRSLYGPGYLVRQDIIVVTLNYRVGPYGFMCLDIPEVPGNQGLKDQQLALKWIKNNIESFGGDTNKITIFGESAGGASVDLQLFYNKDNLFNQMIMQSGTTMNPWATTASDPSVPLKLAEYLGFSSSDVREALSFLSTVDTNLVIAATANFDSYYRPCVEKSFDGVEGFITEHPFNRQIPNVRNVSILIGHNSDEQILDILSPPDDRFNDHFQTFFDFDAVQQAEMERIVKQFYIGDEAINDQTIRQVKDFNSDFLFNYPIQRSIQKYADNGAKNIYQYMFSYIGGRNFMKSRFNINEGGAAHADELGYQFEMDVMSEEPSPQDQLIIDRMATLWANFVKYGNPTPVTSELLPVTWLPVTADSLFYLNIDSELSLNRRQFQERTAFWDLFYKLNNNLQTGI